jgi:hypothetical protein
MTGTDCGLFTHKSVPVIFESPCTLRMLFQYPENFDKLQDIPTFTLITQL